MSPCQPGRAIRAIAESRHPRGWQATSPDGVGNGRPMQGGTPQVSLGVKPPTAAGYFRPEPDRSPFAGGSKDWRSIHVYAPA
jgi:hypothetical protein